MCVRVCVRDRESVCVFFAGSFDIVCMYVCVRERERESVCVCECKVHVCVSVCLCV